MGMRTGRLLRRAAGPLLLLAGCTAAPAPAPEPVPAPPPSAAPAVEPEPRPDSAQAPERIEICVLHQGRMTTVAADVVASGDTLVAGRPFAQVYADTGQYALGRSWYRDNEPIDYDPRNICYAKYGLPRILEADSVVRIGVWRGVPVFADQDAQGGAPEVVYVPVAPGCSFHPYQYFPTMPPVACPQPHRFVTP